MWWHGNRSGGTGLAVLLGGGGVEAAEGRQGAMERIGEDVRGQRHSFRRPRFQSVKRGVERLPQLTRLADRAAALARSAIRRSRRGASDSRIQPVQQDRTNGNEIVDLVV
jgi:hypothetical protein